MDPDITEDPKNGLPEPCVSLGHFLLQVKESFTGDEMGEIFRNLLKCQCSCVDLFFEKLRGSSGVKFAQDRLPDFLRAKDFDNEKQWLLNGIGKLGLSHIIVTTRDKAKNQTFLFF